MRPSDHRHSLPSPPALSGTAGVNSARLVKAASTVRADASAVDSRTLLEGRPRIAIRHRDETYWLHETRQGKLLLTK